MLEIRARSVKRTRLPRLGKNETVYCRRRRTPCQEKSVPPLTRTMAGHIGIADQKQHRLRNLLARSGAPDGNSGGDPGLDQRLAPSRCRSSRALRH